MTDDATAVAAMLEHASHDCPGGCGARVAGTKLTCHPCWDRLPRPLQRITRNAWRGTPHDRRPYLNACAAVLRWYRAHPGGPA